MVLIIEETSTPPFAFVDLVSYDIEDIVFNLKINVVSTDAAAPSKIKRAVEDSVILTTLEIVFSDTVYWIGVLNTNYCR